MRRTRTLILAVLATAATGAWPRSLHAQGDAKPDISGKWAFTVQTDAGSGTPTVTFKQKGDSIAGHYSSQALGEHDFTGTLKDGKLTFGFSADVQGQQFTMSFSGALDGPDAMKGSVDLGGMATGTFTGKRQKP